MINNDYGKVCSSSTIYIVLFDIAFLITIEISSAYVYFYWYLQKVIICVRFNINTQTTIYLTYKWEVSKK